MAGALLLASPAAAQRASGPTPYLATASRTIAEPRPVAAVTAQQSIGTSIELGRVLGANGGGGGALGAILVMSMDRTAERLTDSATARAEALAAPLRESLAGFDVDALALDATRSATSGPAWFNAGETELRANTAPNTPSVRRLFAERHSQASELAFVTWRYQMSPDFSQVQVIALVELIDGTRLTPRYRQQLISIVRLDRPSYVPAENVARWSANDGQPVRQALSKAFARAGEAIPRILELDEPGFTHATDRRRTDRVVAVGYHGPVLFQDAAGPVFWASDGDQNLAAFIAVQTAAN